GQVGTLPGRPAGAAGQGPGLCPVRRYRLAAGTRSLAPAAAKPLAGLARGGRSLCDRQRDFCPHPARPRAKGRRHLNPRSRRLRHAARLLPPAAASYRLPTMIRIASMPARALLLLATLAIAGCGFHLRERIALPADAPPVRVVSSTPYTPLVTLLERTLRNAGAEVAEAHASPDV